MQKSLIAPKWYERERWPFKADEERIDKLTNWVRQIDWKFFCTFSFAWRVSDRQAEKVFDAFTDRLEHALRCEVCFIRGDEKRFPGLGKPASGRHFHVLMTCVAPVNASLIESLWKGMAGNRSDDAGALVEEYNSSENGARYVLKCSNQPDGNWAFRNLELFQPEARNSQKMNKRWRRRLKRFKAQQEKFA